MMVYSRKGWKRTPARLRCGLPPKPREAVLRMLPYSPPTGGRSDKLRLDFNENTVGCSPSVVERCCTELAELYPGLAVHGVIGDFERHLEHLPDGDDRIVAFLGGTIGNFFPEQRARFLDEMRALVGDSGWLLLGTDLIKDVDVLEAAYNDGEGVTAEFNRNILRVINGELGADFDPDAFEHVALFDPQQSWVEMRLRATSEQPPPVQADRRREGARR